MRRLILLALAFTAAAVLVPTVAVADSATHTYLLEMGEPNLGVAANGDQIAITGGGEFSVNPNAVDATGEFTHTNSGGKRPGPGAPTAARAVNTPNEGGRGG